MSSMSPVAASISSTSYSTSVDQPSSASHISHQHQPFTQRPLEFKLLTKTHLPPKVPSPRKSSYLNSTFQYAPYAPYVLLPTTPIASSSRVDPYVASINPGQGGANMGFVLPHQLNAPVFAPPPLHGPWHPVSQVQCGLYPPPYAYEPQSARVSEYDPEVEKTNSQESGYNPVEVDEQQQYTQATSPLVPPPLRPSSPLLEQDDGSRWIRSPTTLSLPQGDLAQLTPGLFPTPRLPPPPPVLRPTSFSELPLSTQLDLIPFPTANKSPPLQTRPPKINGWVPPEQRPIPPKLSSSAYPTVNLFLPSTAPYLTSMPLDLNAPRVPFAGGQMGYGYPVQPPSASSMTFGTGASSSGMSSSDVPYAPSPEEEEGTEELGVSQPSFVPVTVPLEVGQGGFMRELSKAGGSRKKGRRADGAAQVKMSATMSMPRSVSSCPSLNPSKLTCSDERRLLSRKRSRSARCVMRPSPGAAIWR